VDEAAPGHAGVGLAGAARLEGLARGPGAVGGGGDGLDAPGRRAQPPEPRLDIELREAVVDRAILRALADVLTRQTLDAAIEQGLTDLRTQRAMGLDRRVALDRELGLIVARQDRLAAAIADGEAMAPLLARMKAEETRKAAVLTELAGLDGAAGLGELERARTRRLLQAKAADVRGALDRNPDEARAVLASFVDRITLEPFGAGRGRGYQFTGTGSYGALLGETGSRDGGSNGIRTRVSVAITSLPIDARRWTTRTTEKPGRTRICSPRRASAVFRGSPIQGRASAGIGE
jgi:hypothetical protein